jgi:hypothetical protein
MNGSVAERGERRKIWERERPIRITGMMGMIWIIYYF